MDLELERLKTKCKVQLCEAEKEIAHQEFYKKFWECQIESLNKAESMVSNG